MKGSAGLQSPSHSLSCEYCKAGLRVTPRSKTSSSSKKRLRAVLEAVPGYSLKDLSCILLDAANRTDSDGGAQVQGLAVKRIAIDTETEDFIIKVSIDLTIEMKIGG